MKHEYSLPYSQKSVTGPYRGAASSSHPHTCVFEMHFNYTYYSFLDAGRIVTSSEL